MSQKKPSPSHAPNNNSYKRLLTDYLEKEWNISIILNFSVRLGMNFTFTMAKPRLLFQGVMEWFGRDVKYHPWALEAVSSVQQEMSLCPNIILVTDGCSDSTKSDFSVLFWPNLEEFLCQALIFHDLYSFCILWPLHLHLTTRETQNSLPLTLHRVLFFSHFLHPFKTSFSPTDIFHFILVFNPQSRSIPFFFNLHSSQSRS